MLGEIGKLILNQDLEATMMDVRMGLEVEMHRVEKDGRLTTHDFPEELGDQKQNRHIKNDFLNSQSELITPTADNSAEAVRDLTALNHTLRASLSQDDDLLWPLSMPPILPEDLSTLEISHVTPEKAEYYRNWLSRHDIRRSVPTGVHINLSFDDALTESLFAYLKDEYDTPAKLKNAMFDKVVHGFVQYRWLLTYLFGAAPITEKNYYTDTRPDHPVRSLRSSRNFGLFSEFRGDYTSVAAYEKAILAAIDSGQIQGESEFHGPIRLKSVGGLEGMAERGLDYLELRMLDLDPTSSIGVRDSTVRFVRLLVMYFMMTESTWNAHSQQLAEEMNEQVALEPATSMTSYQTQALEFMDKLQGFVADVGLSVNVQRTLKELYQRVVNPATTLSAQLETMIVDDSLVEYAIRQAQMYQDAAIEEIQSRRIYKMSVDGQYVSDQKLREILFDQPWHHVEYPAEIR
ncbi:glutamate--cysteine ligase [Convivina praedatoris]|uniref:Glutamate--cysteine ligase n=1 Tax=Convivina praedatoris TaxID=2880963 RepID=A0ABN8H9L9_9LACO|nr:glutamate--cysteine ligase [Convivina sp. LMG 32447]CAH1853850.1 Glutathione biosynthesis bifunctional protein GshAB [Convivina sp. LMG 32447]CAH1854633.1 Glutathione biosynthesis bifunctional protein GshAB [Convivina sp. LMG 32447]CAH1855264.1 Glutathione biosynthesis bifunctional protein GshAB [Convivina sp. LMG 32447]